MGVAPSNPSPSGGPTLTEQLRAELRRRHYSPRTERAYEHWLARFLRFHRHRHPRDLGPEHLRAFLDDLAARSASPSTQQQALSALAFLYRVVLTTQAPWLDQLPRPSRMLAVPVVLTGDEVQAILLPDRLRQPLLDDGRSRDGLLPLRGGVSEYAGTSYELRARNRPLAIDRRLSPKSFPHGSASVLRSAIPYRRMGCLSRPSVALTR